MMFYGLLALKGLEEQTTPMRLLGGNVVSLQYHVNIMVYDFHGLDNSYEQLGFKKQNSPHPDTVLFFKG